jgi:uncharacterized repeat protein (TIGR01451 family)
VAQIASPLKNDTVIANTASIESGGGQIAAQSPTVTLRVISAPKVTLNKEVDTTGKVSPGDILTYTLSYNNTGNAVATQVVLNDELPEALEYVDGGNYDPAAATVSWNIDTLSIGAAFRHVSFRAKVRGDLVPGFHEIKNIARLSAAEIDLELKSQVINTPVLVPYITIRKMGNKRISEVGGMVTYTITVTNASPLSPIENLRVIDILPRAFGYMDNTTFIDERRASDPLGSRNQIQWKLGTLPAGQETTIVYRTVVGANADLGDGVNVAQATGYTPAISDNTGVPQAPAQDGRLLMATDEVKWRVKVQKGLFSDLGLILGKVYVDRNHDGVQDEGESGVPNVRLILEDGTIITTDRDGKYSLPEVEPGLHVIRIDPRSIDEKYKPTVHSTRFAGDGKQQFVEMSAGGSVKADFTLVQLMEQTPVTAPIIEQPTPVPPVDVKLPKVTVQQPTTRPRPHKVVIVPPLVIQPTPAAAREFKLDQFAEVLPFSVIQPTQSPHIQVVIEPARIPAGDPHITVTADVQLRSVVVRHPDGTRFDTQKQEDGSWHADFLIPFEVSEGPYPLIAEATDLAGRFWSAVSWLTVDNSIPSVYAEFVPNRVTPDTAMILKVTLLFPAREVSVDLSDGTVLQLNRTRVNSNYHWETEYTVPTSVVSGWHNGIVTAVAEDGVHRLSARVAYRVE